MLPCATHRIRPVAGALAGRGALRIGGACHHRPGRAVAGAGRGQRREWGRTPGRSPQHGRAGRVAGAGADVAVGLEVDAECRTRRRGRSDGRRWGSRAAGVDADEADGRDVDRIEQLDVAGRHRTAAADVERAGQMPKVSGTGSAAMWIWIWLSVAGAVSSTHLCSDEAARAVGDTVVEQVAVAIGAVGGVEGQADAALDLPLDAGAEGRGS